MRLCFWDIPESCGFLLAGLLLVTVFSRGVDAVHEEYHAGQSAEHRTALWRQPRRSTRHTPGGHVQVVVDVHTQHVLNTTTELHDMTSEYTGLLGVGTAHNGKPQFQARVVFDTGSTNLWVASVLCKHYPCTTDATKRFYDPHKSISQEPFHGGDERGFAGRDLDIMFGTGELKGPLHVDTYRVGPMVVKKQPFAMIREMNGEVFSSFPFEGILGLGFRSLSFDGIDPFFDRVIEQKLLVNNEFAFYLNADATQPSALLWGGVDKELFEPPIRMFPVTQAHYWALELVDLRHGNQSLLSKSSPAHRAKRLIVDSGTTYFTAPSGLYDKIMSRIPEAPCDSVEKYEPLVYVLRSAGGALYELPVTQKTYMIGNTFGLNCRPAFMQLNVNRKYGPALILGEVFMRHFFTVFSRGSGKPEEAKVGIARARIGARPQVDANVQSPSMQPHIDDSRVVRREKP